MELGLDDLALDLWPQVVNQIEARSEASKAILDQSSLLSVQDGSATIVLKNSFAAELAEKKLAHLLQRLLARHLNQELAVNFITLDQGAE